ncbi:iron(III) transport system permease protein [Deinococcus metalli]|uniref:Iron(III) transport system permease protein n=1 Tax=Deinococcus metalli TaxID=1141878 RepID=A0A7W8KIA5_9DEIO|nr:ABC transporter permease subunit [Deinococcus metalli]MBB5378687.1 iron(III) transport system permease protein [Deinococcus metalli]
MAGAALLVVVGVLLLYPLLSFLLLSFVPGLFGQAGGGVGSFARALDGYALEALRNSLLVGVVSAVISAALGLLLSWLARRTTLPEGRVIEGLMWVLLLTPSYLVSVGWLALIQRGGVLSGLGLDWPGLRTVILGPSGVILVLALAHVPFSYLATASAWSGVGGELDEAARVHGVRPSRRTWLTVRLLAPAVAAAFAVSFAESLGDFGVASTLAANAHFPVATFAIYRALYANPLDFPLASATSWLLLLITGVALLLQARVARRARAYASLTGRSRPPRRVPLGWAGTVTARLGLTALVLLALGIPALGTVVSAFLRRISDGLSVPNITLEYFVAAAHTGLGGPFMYSALLAVLAATVAVALGLGLAGLLSRPTPLARGLDLALLGAMATPGLVLAAGYIFAFNRPFLPLYGTSWLLGVSYAAGGMPSTSRLLLGPVTQLHRSLGEAARTHGLGPGAVLRTITVPLLAAPLFSAWLLSATHIMFELPMSQLLYPPGSPPLPVALVSCSNNFDYSLGAALELEAVGLVLLAVWALRWIFARVVPAGWQRATVPATPSAVEPHPASIPPAGTA